MYIFTGILMALLILALCLLARSAKTDPLPDCKDCRWSHVNKFDEPCFWCEGGNKFEPREKASNLDGQDDLD